MGAMGKHGISATTPENIPFGAGTYHKNLVWDKETKRWTGTLIGATNGGGKVSIEGEYVDLEVDGALVLFKGQTVKTGGKAHRGGKSATDLEKDLAQSIIDATAEAQKNIAPYDGQD